MILNGKMQAAVRKAVVELLASDDEGTKVRALEALAKVMAADGGGVVDEDGTEGEARVDGGLEEERRRMAGLESPARAPARSAIEEELESRNKA